MLTGKEDIIVKILKLMELGNEEKNSNPHERQAAINKAAKLMAEYSIDFVDLRDGKPTEDAFVTMMVDGSDESKVDFEASLAYGIGHAFDCKTINTYREENRWKIAFCGAKHDLEIAVYFFKFLRRTMYAMAAKNVTKENTSPTYTRTGSRKVDVRLARRNYCYGIVTTICSRLEELYLKRAEFIPSNCTALMVVKNDGLRKYFNEQFPNRVSARRTALTGDINAFRRGEADGKGINLSRPISNGGSASVGQIG